MPISKYPTPPPSELTPRARCSDLEVVTTAVEDFAGQQPGVRGVALRSECEVFLPFPARHQEEQRFFRAVHVGW